MEMIEQQGSISLRRTARGLLLPLLFALILPPVCSLILGCEWSGQQINHVPVAVVDHDNSSMSRELVSYIENNHAFDIQRYSDNDDDIKKWMDESKIGAGVIIPSNFMSDIMNGKESKILLIYDGSQMGMAGAVKTRISEIMGTIRTGYLIQIMEGKLNMTPAEAESYIQPVGYTVRMLGNPAKSSANYTLQGLILNICQVSIYCLGIEVGDAIRRGSNKYRRYLLGVLLCGGVGVVTAANSVLIQIGIFKSPFNGTVPPALILTVLNMVLAAGLGMLMILMTKSKFASLMAATIILATVLLSGYTYPVIAMPGLFQKLSPHIHFAHYVIPMRDITLLGVSFEQVTPHIYWLVRFVAAEWLLILVISQSGKICNAVSERLSSRRKTGGTDHNA